jgi:hypothetical protein
MIQPTRRRLLTRLMCFVAAPAIVRAETLMPVKLFEPWPGMLTEPDIGRAFGQYVLRRFAAIQGEAIHKTDSDLTELVALLGRQSQENEGCGGSKWTTVLGPRSAIWQIDT